VKASERIAIVGAGHNALVCACYLAKAGHDVAVFERRLRLGGAVNTEEMWDGYRVDTCSVMHILIHKTPVLRELDLAPFGLEYMDMDPWGFAPFPDGSHIVFHRDLERTCRSIAAVSERDAEAYRAFVLKWHTFNEGVFDLFAQSPAPGAAVGTIARRMAAQQVRGGVDPSMTGLYLLRQVIGSYHKMLDETFTSPQVRAAVAWMAAQSGPPPSEIGAGALAGAHSLYHDVGAKRPRGGSGMLSAALARYLEHHGGTVRCNSPVRRIITSGGKVRGVELEDGERVEADVVVSGAHVHTTMLDLVGRDNLPADLAGRLDSLSLGNGIGMTVRCAVDDLPIYSALGNDGLHPVHSSMQLICPSVEYLQRAYNDSALGKPAERPALVAMTPQYHPYKLADGQSWDDIREREADRILATLAEYAPNVASAVTHRYIQSPLDLERNVGLLRGNIMHLDMSLDQMFMFRPLPELSTYRTPVGGLYLTGASTHPGGGVSGASGRSAAHAVLADMQARERNWRGWAVGGALLGAAAVALRRKR
jgi:phytoene dehydrogenase-like protein